VPALVLAGLSAACAEEPTAVVLAEVKESSAPVSLKQGQIYRVNFPKDASKPSTDNGKAQLADTFETDAVVVSNDRFHKFWSGFNRNTDCANPGYAAFVPLKDGHPELSMLRVLSLNQSHGRLVGDQTPTQSTIDLKQTYQQIQNMLGFTENPTSTSSTLNANEASNEQPPATGSLIHVDLGPCEKGPEACGNICAMVLSENQSNKTSGTVILALLQTNKLNDMRKQASSWPDLFSVLANPTGSGSQSLSSTQLLYTNLTNSNSFAITSSHFITARRLTFFNWNSNPWEPCTENIVRKIDQGSSGKTGEISGRAPIVLGSETEAFQIRLQAMREVLPRMFDPEEEKEGSELLSRPKRLPSKPRRK